MIRACLLAVTLAIVGVPGPGHAGHCDDNLVVFSGPTERPKPNLNTACTVLRENAGDTRLITPGASVFAVRFVRDFGAAYPQITAILDGLGYSGKTITLTRIPLATGGHVYDSGDQALDASKQGCLRARLAPEWGGATAGSTAYHTYSGSC